MPMEFVSLDEFHRRKLRPGEAVSIFVHELKKLLEQSMPSLDKPAKEKLILHQFLAGLLDAVSKQLRATGEVLALDGAVAQTRLVPAVMYQRTGSRVPADDRDVSVVIVWGTYIANPPIAIECRWKLEVVSRAASQIAAFAVV